MRLVLTSASFAAEIIQCCHQVNSLPAGKQKALLAGSFSRNQPAYTRPNSPNVADHDRNCIDQEMSSDACVNLQAGWKESHSTFAAELKRLEGHGLTTLGPALKHTFDLLNINRMQSGIDTYGQVRVVSTQAVERSK